MGKRTFLERTQNLEIKRICIIKPSALGDVVQTLPVLSVLKHRFPKAKISWVINNSMVELLLNHPHIDEVIPFLRRGTFKDWRALLSRLNRSKFDLVFDLQGLLRTGVMTLATRAPLRIGLETAREGSHLACHQLLSDTSRQVPANHRYWRIAEELGLGESRIDASIDIAPQAQNWAQDITSEISGPIIAVQAGAKWITKRWPVEQFARVLGNAMREFNASVLLLGSPDESDLNERLLNLIHGQPELGTSNKNVRNLCSKTSLQQLAAILKRADTVLTNDSGPMHLAAALGTPVVGLFTCTSSVISGPPGASHKLIQAQVPCAASYKKKCPQTGDNHMCCMKQLHSARVWTALKSQLDELSSDKKAA